MQLPKYLVVKSGVTRTPSELGGSIQSRVTRVRLNSEAADKSFQVDAIGGTQCESYLSGMYFVGSFPRHQVPLCGRSNVRRFREGHDAGTTWVEFVRLSRLEQLEDGYLLGPLSKAVHNTGIPSNSSALAVVAQVWMRERNPRRAPGLRCKRWNPGHCSPNSRSLFGFLDIVIVADDCRDILVMGLPLQPRRAVVDLPLVGGMRFIAPG